LRPGNQPSRYLPSRKYNGYISTDIPFFWSYKPADKYLTLVIPSRIGVRDDGQAERRNPWRYPAVLLDAGSKPVLDSDPGSGMTDFNYLVAGLIKEQETILTTFLLR
jgi:hypothetical protein